MPDSSVMNYFRWVEKVRESIAKDWLELIDFSPMLKIQFNNILLSLHMKYKPQEDGSWSASPRWQDMFNWTSCPLEGVRTVFLLKKPKTESSDWSSPFKSNGYAGGVERNPVFTDGQAITEIGTVWAMLEVARQCLPCPDEDLDALVAKKYQNGFNPKCLSQRGLLFLNVALTTGNSDHMGKENSDMTLWQDFTLGLLDAIQGKGIPMFQWYITKVIKEKLSEWKVNGKFVVSKPKALDLGEGPFKHICYFEESHISEYAMELAADEYQEHKGILKEIYHSVVCESNAQSYPGSAMQPHTGTKRHADTGSREHQEEEVSVSRRRLSMDGHASY